MHHQTETPTARTAGGSEMQIAAVGGDISEYRGLTAKHKAEIGALTGLGTVYCRAEIILALAPLQADAAAARRGQQLRPYQIDVIARIKSKVAEGRRRILKVAPTGAGKTITAASLIETAIATGQRVLFLAHRRELIQQASQKLYAVGIEHGIIQAGFPTRPGERVQLASNTLHARAIRPTPWICRPPILLSSTRRITPRPGPTGVLAAYPEAVILGLTATPCRGDGRGLGNAFQSIVETPGRRADRGRLSRTDQGLCASQPDLTGVKVRTRRLCREAARRAHGYGGSWSATS